MSARQPKHAQPSVLAGLRWSSVSQWAGVALLVALVIGVVATVEAPSHPAAARAPAAPVAVASSSATGQVDGIGPQTEQPPSAVSLAPSISSTYPGPTSGALNDSQASSLASDGIPTTALQAYELAADRERLLRPACGLSWPLLAGIGRAESDHGRFAGAVLHTDGISSPPVIGIALNGNGTALILDTDGGRLDGDRVYDRAVGPMQFIPSTWAGYGVDGNGDGVKDPFNIFDAAAGAANYLCAVGSDLTTLAGQMRAVRVYNDSDAYISVVLQLEAIYASGVPGLTVPVVPTNPAPSPPRATIPPANPGPPLGMTKPKPPRHKPTKKPKPSTPASSSPAPTASNCPTPSVSPTTSDSTSATATTSTSATTTETSTPSTSSTSGCPTPTPSDTATTTQPAPTDSTSLAAPSTSSSTSTAPPAASPSTG